MSEAGDDMGLNPTFCKSMGCIEMITSLDKMNDHLSDKSCISCAFVRESIYFTLRPFQFCLTLSRYDHSAGQNWSLFQKSQIGSVIQLDSIFSKNNRFTHLNWKGLFCLANSQGSINSPLRIILGIYKIFWQLNSSQIKFGKRIFEIG